MSAEAKQLTNGGPYDPSPVASLCTQTGLFRVHPSGFAAAAHGCTQTQSPAGDKG